MRISTVFQFIALLALLAVGGLLITGRLSANGLYDTYQRLSSGTVGSAATASNTVTATASIAPLDGYTYAGQLDATITFTEAGGTKTVYDLHYPTDYNMFHDGFGPLWLANWNLEIANNPQVSPVLGNSCLQTINGENLAPSPLYQTAYKEYLVCRVLDEERPDAPRSYDITRAKPAVIGVIWASANHQPMDDPRERCVAEVRIWSTEIAKPSDRFIACVFVISEAPQQVEIYAFELTEDSIVEVGGASEGWSRAAVETRDVPQLGQYRFMQEWLADPQAHAAAVERAYAHVAANLDQVVPQRVSQFDRVEYESGVINFTFSAKDTAEMFRIRDGSEHGADRQLYQLVRPVVCGSDERAALLAFQENAPAYKYDLNESDGQPMTQFGTLPNLPC